MKTITVKWVGGNGSYVAKVSGVVATLLRGPADEWNYELKYLRGQRRWETAGSFRAKSDLQAKRKVEQHIVDFVVLL